MEQLEQIKKELKEILSETRYEHSIRVMEKAEELAKIHGVDVEKAKLCGLTHDIAKEMTVQENFEYLKKNKISIDRVQRKNIKLLHGKIGADLVKKKYHFPLDMQKAIEYHTTTNPHMDKLAKIIYIADKIEEGRTSPKRDLEIEREMAKQNLDDTMIYIINESVVHMLKQEKLIHPKCIETRNKLLSEKKKQERKKEKIKQKRK